MFSLLFLSYSALHLIIALSLVWLLKQRGYVPGAVFVAFISFALVFDNGMIALGSRIGPGELLETLSYPRFLMHAAFTPVLMFVAWLVARAAGLAWTGNRVLYALLWALVLAMSGLGIYHDLVGGLELQVACLGDTLRYTSSAPPQQFCSPDQVSLPGLGAPIPSIATIIVCLLVGGALWRAHAWPWLFVTAAIMFVAAGMPQDDLGPAVGNFGEIVLQAGFAATLWRFAAPPAAPAG